MYSPLFEFIQRSRSAGRKETLQCLLRQKHTVHLLRVATTGALSCDLIKSECLVPQRILQTLPQGWMAGITTFVFAKQSSRIGLLSTSSFILSVSVLLSGAPIRLASLRLGPSSCSWLFIRWLCVWLVLCSGVDHHQLWCSAVVFFTQRLGRISRHSQTAGFHTFWSWKM